MHIIALALVCLFLIFITFSLRYHPNRTASLVIAGGVSAGALGGAGYLFAQLPGVEGVGWTLPAGSWVIGWAYGLLYGQRAGGPPSSKKAVFSLSAKGGRRITFGDPLDNFLVYAGANAGKTKSIGKPLLQQYIQQGWAGFVYDYKDFDYSRTAWNLAQQIQYPHEVYTVNFVDPSTSHRFNPIKPSVLKDEVLLMQLMTDLFEAKPQDIKGDRIWTDAALGLLKGVAYRFYKDYPQYCTIPHICNFVVQAGHEKLTAFVREAPESRGLASGFIDSIDSEKTRASILTTLTTALSDLVFNKKIQYVLSGDDFDFNLIDPQAPKLVAVSNSYSIEAIISPVVALLITMASRAFRLGNPVPCFFFLDEGTTIKVPNFEKLPSVLREYGCSFTFLTQSGAKIEKLYGKLDRSSIESNFGNIFLGRTKDTEALKTYGLLFSRKEEKRRSFTRGQSGHGSSSSTTVSASKEQRYEPHFYTQLQAGEFVGSAAHSNYQEFHLRFNMYDGSGEQDLPVVRTVLDTDIERNYQKILADNDSVV